MIAKALIIMVSYFIGNISPSILIGRAHGIDIKKEGSGNAGATNTLRILGKKAAAATLTIDILKGVTAVLLGEYFFGREIALICGFAVFCGHIWPVAFKFKGGKGVATALGVVMATAPIPGSIAIIIAFCALATTKRVSAASIIAAAILPVAATLYDRDLMMWSISLAAVILLKHRQNIKRLLKGEEPKLSFKK